jgi:hypothetical protein
MIAQQHKIMRQVLEVSGCPSATAQQIQLDLRGTYYQRLLPVIEKVCSDLSSPGRIQRIDSLEIDLGEVPLEALESAVVDKFEAVFSSELAAAIGDESESKFDSDLELFDYFIRTGAIPWWANSSEQNLLEVNLDNLIRNVPQALLRMFQTTSEPERMLRRIVLTYSDNLLDDLVSVMAPTLFPVGSSMAKTWLTMFELSGELSNQGGFSRRAVSNFWWQEVLRAANHAEHTPASEAPRFFAAILKRVARHLGRDYRSLISQLHCSLENNSLSVPPWTREITEHLWQAQGGASAESDESNKTSDREASSLSETVRVELLEILTRLERRQTPDADFWIRFHEAISQLPVRLQGQVRTAFEIVEDEVKNGEKFNSTTRDKLVALIRLVLEQKSELKLDATQLRDVIQPPTVDTSEKSAAVNSNFSDVDVLYLGNAGLVILWPFLENFFERLGLTEDKKFKDAAASQRAVGLLQYIADINESPQEILLPLNKVLCGMAPEEVFDFGAEITEGEKEECNDLLVAVIQQAPILNEMSNAGFRASFLLRQGQLGARDGNWLLRVERETHDIVLDRFPWSVHIVKLPWMETIMQVEW